MVLRWLGRRLGFGPAIASFDVAGRGITWALRCRPPTHLELPVFSRNKASPPRIRPRHCILRRRRPLHARSSASPAAQTSPVVRCIAAARRVRQLLPVGAHSSPLSRSSSSSAHSSNKMSASLWFGVQKQSWTCHHHCDSLRPSTACACLCTRPLWVCDGRRCMPDQHDIVTPCCRSWGRRLCSVHTDERSDSDGAARILESALVPYCMKNGLRLRVGDEIHSWGEPDGIRSWASPPGSQCTASIAGCRPDPR